MSDAGTATCLGVDLAELIGRSPLAPPVLVRFPSLLDRRVESLARGFEQAMAQDGYSGRYRGVYPIKANQQAAVVERLYAVAQPWGMGLEAGSKPELVAVLGIVHDPDTPIVCNGFKDAAYVDLVLMGIAMGRSMFPVAESLDEALMLATRAAERGLADRLSLGIRLRLRTRVSGRWENSGGEGSKFGIDAAHLPALVQCLRDASPPGLLERLRLVHFHPGSQIDDLPSLEPALRELAGHYADLRDAGAPVDHLDVGGGLGVHYTGGLSKDASMHYSDRDYADCVVRTVAGVCRDRGVPEPNLITESGRALVAHHCVLVFDVRGEAGRNNYLINGSVFQSLPDHWALGHRFPVCPLQRLHEPPAREVRLADITCDSDGHIAGFIDDRSTIALHDLVPGQPYHVGVFLVGAYQETLGDMHNLFGRINEIAVDDAGRILEARPGDNVAAAISAVGYDPDALAARFAQNLRGHSDADELRRQYDHAMHGYTYLT